MFNFCVMTASAIMIGLHPSPTYHSVQFFDNAIRVTQRVLDRSICADVEKQHPYVAPNGMNYADTDEKLAHINLRRDREITALSRHCSLRLQADGKPTKDCGEGATR